MLAFLLAALLSVDRVATAVQGAREPRPDLRRRPPRPLRPPYARRRARARRPFGIGPLQFHKIFPEDPHNTYLNSFLSGGWLSGVVYLTLTLTTPAAGCRFVFVRRRGSQPYIAVYAAYVGVAVESAIIDSDHWRHYFLLVGVIWGLMAVSRAYRRREEISLQAAVARA